MYALSLVGGTTHRVHTEDVALKCHELFPSSFSWTKHPHLPDKDIVRVALTDARKESHGALVDGRSGQTTGQSQRTRRNPTPDGWILTTAGLAFLAENEVRLADFLGRRDQKSHRQAVQRQVQRIRSHRLFRDYQDHPDGFGASIGELADLLRCRVDAEPRVWDRRFEGLRLVAVASDDSDLPAFVDRLEHLYQTQR